MKIAPDNDDAQDFVAVVQNVANGVVRRHAPEILALIKIDNWFGSKWLGFSGKALGAIGVWNKPDGLRIPPFVPNRVISQRRFIAPDYVEIDSGKPIHTRMESTDALLRKAAVAAPNTALIWYSGNSNRTGRGAVMVYMPVGDSYLPWYTGWKKDSAWRLLLIWLFQEAPIDWVQPRRPRTTACGLLKQPDKQVATSRDLGHQA